MDYRIEVVDINDKDVLSQINFLLGNVFGSKALADEKLENNTVTENTQNQSLYLAALIGSEIIGFTGFISHTFYYNNKTAECYQACWAATNPNHREKKIFQNLIEASKVFLKERGAGFILGFPNHNSHPIMVNKLGFRETDSVKLQVPNNSLVIPFFLAEPQVTLPELHKNTILQNDKQLIELKRKEYGKDLIILNHNNSYVWGVRRKIKKASLKLTYFDIGGIELQNPADMKPLIELISGLKNTHYFQIVTTVKNTYNTFFKGLKPAQTNNLIVFDLNLDTTNCRFNFYGGVKDVF